MDQRTHAQDDLAAEPVSEPTLTNGIVIPADKVAGTDVYNGDGERLGHIHDIMIDKLSGRVAFALMSFGGFLGIGERFHPLPWGVLNYDREEGGFVVDLDRDTLERAPNYDFDTVVDWDDADWRTGVYDHYGAPHYWI